MFSLSFSLCIYLSWNTFKYIFQLIEKGLKIKIQGSRKLQSKRFNIFWKYLNADGPQLRLVQLKNFQFCDMHSTEPYCEFWIFMFFQARDKWYNTFLGCWAVVASCRYQLAVQTWEWNPIHLQPFYTDITILIFTFNTVFSKLHEIVSTLLLNTFCVGWFCPTVS